MLPENINAILEFTTSETDQWSLSSRKGIITIDAWSSATPQPTEQEILDTAASQAFLDWEAENGGDSTLTARKQVKEALDTPAGKLLEAFILELLSRGILPGTPAQVKTILINRIAAGDVD